VITLPLIVPSSLRNNMRVPAESRFSCGHLSRLADREGSILGDMTLKIARHQLTICHVSLGLAGG
jgi:hypothetical protein